MSLGSDQIRHIGNNGTSFYAILLNEDGNCWTGSDWIDPSGPPGPVFLDLTTVGSTNIHEYSLDSGMGTHYLQISIHDSEAYDDESIRQFSAYLNGKKLYPEKPKTGRWVGGQGGRNL